MNDEDFEEVYSDCTDEKYSFMYIDKSSGTPKFYKRFEYVVKLPERKNTSVGNTSSVYQAKAGSDTSLERRSVVDVIKNDE